MVDGVAVACPACSHPNPAGQKFCGNCGSPLLAVCPACSSPNPAGQRFCGSCGGALPGATPAAPPQVAAPATAPVPAVAPPAPAITPPPHEEERRLVTALFCDLVGFTPLTESLDPEEVREIQTAYFGQMSAEISRFGGTVEKYAGDAVLALFGAPTAHEDDAERAVRCALAMQVAFRPVAEEAGEHWKVDLAVRIGVNTGEAISGAWDVEGRRDYSATGDVVNTAARLQSAADPGGVIVGQETMHLARRAVLFGPRRDLTLKGKATAFPAYPVLGLREQVAERWEVRGQRAPLLGRDRELAQLMDIWARVQEGEGRLVSLVAEAGVGKSRLVAEAVERMSAVAGTVVARGRCLSYGQQLSLHLVTDLVRNLCQVREGDDHERMRSNVRTWVDSLLAPWDAETRAAADDVFGMVLGLPPGESIVANADPKVRRQTLVRSLQLMLSALATYRPAIVVLEDLHWIDTASAEVLEEVLPIVADYKALVLATHRPHWDAPWHGRPQTATLALQPLAEGDALGLVRAILGDMELEPELERQVAERAGGNPFFVEELLRSLQETESLEERDGRIALVPGAKERLPSTLTEVLLARLDQLERPARSVAQVGSVIGRSFAVPLLARVSEQEESGLEAPLSALHQAEIALPRQGVGREYIFKHATVREVAYNTLLLRRRQALHAATARAMIRLYPVDEHVDVIAYHFAKTQDHAEAARWLERAADHAAAAYANTTAIEQYEETRRRLEKCGAEDTALARVNEKAGRVLKTVARYDEALEALERAARVYEESGDLESERRVVAEIGRVHRARATPEQGIVRIEGLLASAAHVAPSQGLASLYVALARLFFAVGRYREQLAAASRSHELASAVGDGSILAEAQMSRGTALYAMGHLEEALQVQEATIPLAESAGQFDILNIVLGNVGLMYMELGEFEQSRAHRERALAVADRMGDPANAAFAMAILGETLFYLGEWDQARTYQQRSVEMVHTFPTSWFSAYPFIHLGRLLLVTGEWKEASNKLQEALSIAEPSGDLQALKMAHCLLAELNLLQGQADAAVARLDKLLDRSKLDEEDVTLVRPTVAWAHLELGNETEAGAIAAATLQRAVDTRSSIGEVEIQRVSAMLATRQNRWEDAVRALECALSLTRVMRYPYGEARILYEYGLMYLRKREPDKARQRLEDAQVIFRRLGAQPYADRAEQALNEPIEALRR